MEILELKPVENKRIVAYTFTKEDSKELQSINLTEFNKFLNDKHIDFAVIDFDVNIKDFNQTSIAQAMNKLKIPYYQVDIPEYAMGYLYHEIVEKEELSRELTEEYRHLEDRDSFKGQSLKNWIDLVNMEIQEKEIFLSLRLRPMWIVKKILNIAENCQGKEVAFVHFVQTDICEDICAQVVENLRNMSVKVIQYNKKHTIKNVVF